MTNYTDKELLELAVRAWMMNCLIAGMSPEDSAKEMLNGNDFFNPLNNDGDALRLAVKLGIATRRISNKAMASSSVGQFDEYCDNDPCAATRRAIVRAAAAIGSKL